MAKEYHQEEDRSPEQATAMAALKARLSAMSEEELATYCAEVRGLWVLYSAHPDAQLEIESLMESEIPTQGKTWGIGRPHRPLHGHGTH